MFPEPALHTRLAKPVNVASVPHRSPFRYPGGKTWFVPTFRAWLNSFRHKPRVLLEPFAGGGIISLTALFENLVERAVMVELDQDVAAVWKCVAAGKSDQLANKILKFKLDKDSLSTTLAKPPANIIERAFQTILKNRTLHGGILADGAGFIKKGENGKGLTSRWYPTTLARRFFNLQNIHQRLDFFHGDGLLIMHNHLLAPDTIFFIDPPYTAGGKKAGRRLYRHSDLNHGKLFALCSRLKGDFLMTYDVSDEAQELARHYGFETSLIAMKNTHHSTMQELLIGKNLDWLRY